MKIHTFASGSEDLPENARAIARIRMSFPSAKGKMADDWHPVVFHAATMEAARSAAQDWWDEQLAKERQKVANAAAAGERMRARKAAKPAAAAEIMAVAG